MPQSIEQLVYISFSTLESKMLASTKMPQAVQQIFEQSIVHPYLNNPAFSGLKMSAAYLHQIESNALLFGWLYCDEVDQDSEELIARFICYYSTQSLDGEQLELIFKCLEKGPATPFKGWATLNVLGPVVLPDSGDYEPTRPGVAIPSRIRAKTRLLLYKQKLLHCFVPSEELIDDLDSPGIQTEFVDPSSVIEEYSHLASTSVTLANKYALLIGVSNQHLGIRTIPGVEQDVETLQKVLADPLIGNFSEVSVLLNPDSPTMAERIESFLNHCPADSMAIIYFSGYGILDRQGTLCLSTGSSRRNEQGKIIRSTFVATDFLAAVMRDGVPQQKILILDICFSTEEIDNDAGRQQTLDLARQQLGASGHTILVSSTAKGDVGSQKGFRPSVYTFYLVEGLATGIADKNGDGLITLEELHTYAKHKAKVTSPALSPALYGEISEKQRVIAMAPVNNPKLRYRREVERLAQNGSISLVNELMLNSIQKMLNLSPKDATKIEVEVFKPYKDYQLKLRQFALKYLNQFYQENRDNINARSEVLSLQNSLGLTDKDIEKIKAEVFYQFNEIQSSDPVLSPLITEGEIQVLQVSLRSQLSYLFRASLQLSTVKGYLNRCLISLSKIKFQDKFFSQVRNFLESKLLFQNKASAWMGGLSRTPLPRSSLSNQKDSSWSFRWRLGGLSLGLIFALMGFCLLSLALWNARQKQAQQMTVQELENFVRQQKYDRCFTLSPSLSQGFSRLTVVQSLLEQCKAGLPWQKASLQTVSTSSSEVQAIAFRPNSQILAGGSDDGKIRLWDVEKQGLIQTLNGHLSRVWSIAFSQDGRLLASGSSDKTVNLWSLSTNKRLHSFKDHKATVWATTFVSDGRLLASGSEDGTIKLWNVLKGTLDRTINPKVGAIRALAAGVDGKTLYSGGADKAITAWDVDTGKPRLKLQTYGDRVIALAVNKDETLLASGSVDKTITVWNLRNGTLLRTIAKNDASIQNLAFSADNRTLAGNVGGTIRIWDIQTGQFIWKFADLPSKVTAMDFGRNGQTVAIARQDKVLNLLQPEGSR
jgi:WD40 repeat protein